MGVTKRGDSLHVNIHVEGKMLKQVTSSKYLGNLIVEDGRYDKEIQTRIGLIKQI